MVGWRQEEGSSCRVMVRVTEAGVEKTAWADLHDVRLAEHRSHPPTESLPFIPRLPRGRTEEITRSGASGGWDEQHGLSELSEAATSRAPRADAATRRTSLVPAMADDVEPDTGRHRAPTGVRHEGNDHDVRLPASRSGYIPAGPVARTHREHEAGAALASWWPSSGEPSSRLGEVEPTRLLTLPRPHHWQATAPRHGVFPAH
jgi:hypothetical protein